MDDQQHASYFDHVRLFGNYTAEEEREMLSVHRIYKDCFKQPLFPAITQTPLALVDEQSNKPQHTINEYDLKYLSPPTQPGELFPIAEGAVRLIIHFLAALDRRWWYRGYPNSPLRLTCITLKRQFARLANAPCNEDTQTQLIQLRKWLVQLMSEEGGRPIFRHEPQSKPDTFGRLLSNLLQTMDSLQKPVKRRLAMTSSRERFVELRHHQQTLLNMLTQFLFYVASDKKKDGSFSLATAQKLRHSALKKQLNNCREGLVLQNIIFHPRVKGLLGHAQTQSYMGHVVPLFAHNEQKEAINDSPTITWLNEIGEANPALVCALVNFDKRRITPTYRRQQRLTQNNALLDYCKQLKQKRLALKFIQKPLTLCPVFTTDSIAPFVKLHGLALIFVEYCHYTEALWVLAGFGGDRLICRQIGQLVSGLLDDAKAVIIAIENTVQQLSEGMQSCYNEAVDNNKHKVWRNNYNKAQLIWEGFEEQSKHYKKKLDVLLQTIKEPALYDRKSQLAQEALQTALGAIDFSNSIAGKLGFKQKIIQLPALPAYGCRQMDQKKDDEEKGQQPLATQSVNQVLSKSKQQNHIIAPTTGSNDDTLTRALKHIYQKRMHTSNKLDLQENLFVGQFTTALTMTLGWWYRWLFAGTCARHEFVTMTKPILERYYALMGPEVPPKDTVALNKLKHSLSQLRQKAQTVESSLWWLFQWETKTFLNLWISVIKRLELEVDTLLLPSPSRDNVSVTTSTAMLTKSNELELKSYTNPVKATQISYSNGTESSVKSILDNEQEEEIKKNGLTSKQRQEIYDKEYGYLDNLKIPRVNNIEFDKMTNKAISWMETQCGTDRNELYRSVGLDQQHIHSIDTSDVTEIEQITKKDK